MPDMPSSIDALVERLARNMAQRISRRSFIGGVGALLFGAAGMPLLPVARGESTTPARPDAATDPGDPQSCEYGGTAPSMGSCAAVAEARDRAARRGPSTRPSPG